MSRMGKKNDKSIVKDNKQITEDELSKSPDLTVPHTCTGQFQVDFTELCRRLQPPLFYIPQVISRPHRPTSPANLPVIDEKPGKAGKAGKKEDAKNVPAPEPIEAETPALTELGEIPEQPPKTYTTKDRSDYFRPSIQVEVDVVDKSELVTEVYIRGWKVDETMMDVLRQCWSTMTKLNTISLWSAGLTESTVEMLASVIPSVPTLRLLILDNNPVKGEPWHLLMKDESSVQQLSLRYNSITDVGAETIGAALSTVARQNQKLVSLNLAGNKITDKGASHLAKGLRFNRCLLSLGLNGNLIGDEGAKCLAEVVSRFALSHEEIVARRRLLSVNVDRKSTRSASPSSRKDRHDRPGSVRGNSTTPSQNAASTNPKGTASKKDTKTKKSDTKSKDEEAKHDKTKGKAKEAEKPAKKDLSARRPSAANVAMDAMKFVSKKPEKTAKGKKSAAPTEPEALSKLSPEVPDANEVVNPLVEPVETLQDGTVLMTGNMMLINLNLADNQIDEAGVDAFINAVKYQTTTSRLAGAKSNSYGLMRLSLQRNKFSADCGSMKLLNALMATRDPVSKSGRESEMSTV